MGVVSRTAQLVPVIVMVAIVAGCGGSVADADSPIVTRTPTRPQSAFCLAVQPNSDALRQLNTIVTRGGGRPDELRAAVDTVRRTGAELVAQAPAEIDDDVRLVVSTVNLQVDALGVASGAQPTNPDIAARLNSPELLKADQRVRAYVTQSCGRSPSTNR